MRPARIAGAVGLAYIGMNGAITGYSEQIRAKGYEPYPTMAIGSPPPLLSWQRERIIRTSGGTWLSSSGEGADFGFGYRLVSTAPCSMPEVETLRRSNADLDAFLFWSRAPFAERAADGSVVIRDARFYDPRARDRFTVALKNVQCEPKITTARPEPVEGRERGAGGLRQAQPEQG